jgi:hypothetical protein
MLALYFAKRLTNKVKQKIAYEFQEKFCEVLHLLRNFLRLKKSFRVARGSVNFRTLNGDSMEFGRNWTYMPGKRILLALMDLQDTLVRIVRKDHIKQPHFSLLLSKLRTLKSPLISIFAIWVWILNLANKLAQAAKNARNYWRNYTILESKYISVK